MKTKITNPIIKSIYTADPAPMVVGDTLYLYTTHAMRTNSSMIFIQWLTGIVFLPRIW